ncbi:MAG TPA: family 78 glycoside hydrolase catalytic domain [Oscillospiraceae bacterium]|nr:family 78 glycoside hydrolase catalytic domain [Oscillospiraceae bacterium]HPF55783.1 family 78 glycoside hydrolase catalytic domain [Clostridiales bacterium]HPR74631.1 family 78 glycoside hydrolase catalytic domain [Oscillospiraceae bacterium]
MSLKIYDLTVNDLKDHVGFDTPPRFSWKVRSTLRGESQTHYRIVLSADYNEIENGRGGLWDTDWIHSGESLYITYTGEKLKPLTRYYWRVGSWGKGRREIWSDIAFFETGKLDSPWKAKWITADFIDKAPKSVQKEQDALAAPYLRKVFSVKKPIKTARLVICGLGYFEAYLNGDKVGDDFLSTPPTQYDITSLYRVFDVTKQLKTGDNALAAVLGNGFYNCFTDDPWNSSHAPWRGWPRMIAELHITYSDDTKTVISTDGSWKSDKGPIYFNGIRHGEHYDARAEQPGWNTTDFDDSNWHPSRLMRSPGGVLKAMEMEPIRICDRFTAVDLWQTPDGWVFDVGQNQGGIGAFVFRGKAGTEITIRYSDLLTPERRLTHKELDVFIKNYCFQTDKYIKRTDDEEIWHPIFTYHGFQYIEISGIDYTPQLSDVTALTLHNDVAGDSVFSCSDEVLNKVQHMCRWSSTSCMMGIFSSDTHREKSAWTGDGSLSSEQLTINFGVKSFLGKWLGDIRRAQRIDGAIPCIAPTAGWGYNSMNGPDWSSAIVDVPWNLYVATGDKQVLEENYEAIQKHFAFMERMAVGDIVHYGLGDWCPPFEGEAVTVNMSKFKCPTEVTDTAYYHTAAKRLAQMAEILGKKRDGMHYQRREKEIKNAFRNAFFDAVNDIVKGNCQTSTGVMIYHGFAEPEELPGLYARLLTQIDEQNWHLDFGVLGNKAVMQSLGAAGLGEVGIKMLLQPDFPSVRRWVELNANTLWETWNGGGSHNHHMFSDLSAFFYKYIAGISADEDEPGYAHIIARPALTSGLSGARCEVSTVRGPVGCRWFIANGEFTVELDIPSSCHATLYLPVGSVELTESGVPVEDAEGVQVNMENNQPVLELVCGSYRIEGKL